jgi:hypothetical protein
MAIQIKNCKIRLCFISPIAKLSFLFSVILCRIQKAQPRGSDEGKKKPRPGVGTWFGKMFCAWLGLTPIAAAAAAAFVATAAAAATAITAAATAASVTTAAAAFIAAATAAATAATITAAAATAFVAAAATTFVTAAAATTASAGFASFSCVDAECTTLIVLVVQCCNCCIGACVICHGNEGKATWAPCFTISNDFDTFNGAMLAEEIGYFFFSSGEGQIAHIDIHNIDCNKKRCFH